MIRRLFYILLLLCLFVCTYAQGGTRELSVAERNAAQGFNDTIDRMADDFVTVSLVVCDPGTILYTVLGHACLHLECPSFDMDYFFSYESESVEGKVLRFLRGGLKMGMARISPKEFLQPYIEEGRGVRAYALNLPPEVKMELWRMCDERVEQGMQLEYDPVKRGCAISVLHSVEDAITSANRRTGKQCKIVYPEWGEPFDRTLREIFYDNAPHGWGLFWCMTIVGGIVDEPNLPKEEKLICPRELVETWQQSTIDGVALLSNEAQLLHEGNAAKVEAFTPLYASLLILVLALVSVFWKRPYLDWGILALQTLLGCALVWLWLMPLPATGWSWLLIPFNPLPLIFRYWRRYWALPYAVITFLWCVIMTGVTIWGHILVDWPHIILAAAFGIILVKQRLK